VKRCGTHGCDDSGEHSHEFVCVVSVKLRFLQNPGCSSRFSRATGSARPFNDVAVAPINCLSAALGDQPQSLPELPEAGMVEYVDFPDSLIGKYQCYAQPDRALLRRAECDHTFSSFADGFGQYASWLRQAI
jgi:ADP-L-glycero-D-manno-heptose 6-epimerase